MWKKVFHENGNQKKTEVAIFISEKICTLKEKLCLLLIGDKERQLHNDHGSIQEDLTNICL